MNDRVAVFMLDVGQGDCSVVLLPNGNAVVFDCADDVVLRKLLDAWRVTKIEAFVLSHLDQDHIGGALQFLLSWPFAIGCVYMSVDRNILDEHDDAKRAKALVDHVVDQSQEAGSRPRRWELSPNTRDQRALAEGPGWSVHLLAPPHAQILRREREGSWEDANCHSSILQIVAGENTMLIGGDAPLLSWSALRGGERRSIVFRIPHHGGALDDGGIPPGWDVDRLYREVDAQTALVSVGTNNSYGHPDELWVKPITAGACHMLCTQVTARCHAPLEVVATDGRVIRDSGEIAAQRQRLFEQGDATHWVEAPWRHLTDRRGLVKKGLLEVPCAGTVVVSLHLDGHVQEWPVRGGDHERLVDTWQKPLCRSASP